MFSTLTFTLLMLQWKCMQILVYHLYQIPEVEQLVPKVIYFILNTDTDPLMQVKTHINSSMLPLPEELHPLRGSVAYFFHTIKISESVPTVSVNKTIILFVSSPSFLYFTYNCLISNRFICLIISCLGLSVLLPGTQIST